MFVPEIHETITDVLNNGFQNRFIEILKGLPYQSNSSG
nr:MAG TPA: hypothetical protein [Caudoviricetes sp.]